MRYEDLERWRKAMDISVTEACELIGITTRTWYWYRSERDKGQPLPPYIGYACFCIYHRLGEWERPTKELASGRKRRMSPASLANLKRGKE